MWFFFVFRSYWPGCTSRKHSWSLRARAWRHCPPLGRSSRGETVLQTFLIEGSKINAHPPFLVRFLNENDIGQPVWVNYFTDEANLHEFFVFLDASFCFTWSMFLFFCQTRFSRELTFSRGWPPASLQQTMQKHRCYPLGTSQSPSPWGLPWRHEVDTLRPIRGD